MPPYWFFVFPLVYLLVNIIFSLRPLLRYWFAFGHWLLSFIQESSETVFRFRFPECDGGVRVGRIPLAGDSRGDRAFLGVAAIASVTEQMDINERLE